jgi:hypothetical protein
LKAILKCRGLSIDVDGRKGKQAKQLLQDRLDAYMKDLTSSENPGEGGSIEVHTRCDKMISSIFTPWLPHVCFSYSQYPFDLSILIS